MKNEKGNVLLTMVVVIGIFVGVAAVGSALNLITIPWLRFDSKVQMERDIVRKTFNADNALYNYHWFQERAGSIKALESQIVIADSSVKSFEATAGPRSEWGFEDKGEHARLSAVAQGLKNERRSQIEEYNARLNEADRSMFADDLPLFFEL